MIEELVKYWEEYKNQIPKINIDETTNWLNPPSFEGYMDYLSDKFKKDEN